MLGTDFPIFFPWKLFSIFLLFEESLTLVVFDEGEE